MLLILVDSMRWDMPWNGYPREIAPVLTELEKDSVSYSRGYAVSSYTAKSVAALLSGRYPTSLKRSGYFFTKYPESNQFFAELLEPKGVHTMAGHAHMYLRPGNTGMDQGFVDWRVVEGITFNNKTDEHVTSDKLTQLAIEQLRTAPEGKPKFMYLHYMDPHDQYVQHEESPKWGRKMRDRYDSEIFFTDMWIGKLLDYCRKQPWWKNTTLIVTADHGEAFGEHGRHRHAFELYEMLVRVPLFLRVPGAKPRQIAQPRGAIDLAPTILDLMGHADLIPSDLPGKSLVPELFGEEAPQRAVLMDLPPDSNNDERRAFVLGDYKLLVFGGDYRYELYDVKEDWQEKHNLARKEKDVLERMKAAYQQYWGEIPKVKPYGGNKLINGSYATGPRE